MYQEGIRLLFTNDFTKAEETFRDGSKGSRPAGAVRDTRGAFALIYTMVSFMPHGAGNGRKGAFLSSFMANSKGIGAKSSRFKLKNGVDMVNGTRFGLLSFANDQLDECLTRVWTAESLLLEDAPWVGQKLLGSKRITHLC